MGPPRGISRLEAVGDVGKVGTATWGRPLVRGLDGSARTRTVGFWCEASVPEEAGTAGSPSYGA